MSAEYKKGPHTVYDIQYHLVWVTKYRYHVLTGEVAQLSMQFEPDADFEKCCFVKVSYSFANIISTGAVAEQILPIYKGAQFPVNPTRNSAA